MAKNHKEPKPLIVQANTFVGSTYSQIVGVTVTDFDITIEFVYKHPREDVEQAQVVSRVTLPKPAGENLAKSILDTIKLHEARKKGKKNGTN